MPVAIDVSLLDGQIAMVPYFADVYEQVTLPLDDDYAQALVTRESRTMVPRWNGSTSITQSAT
mgnify:CR=1 FL=1